MPATGVCRVASLVEVAWSPRRLTRQLRIRLSWSIECASCLDSRSLRASPDSAVSARRPSRLVAMGRTIASGALFEKYRRGCVMDYSPVSWAGAGCPVRLVEYRSPGGIWTSLLPVHADLQHGWDALWRVEEELEPARVDAVGVEHGDAVGVGAAGFLNGDVEFAVAA